MRVSFRAIIGLLVLVFSVVSVMPAAAGEFPNKSIVWIVPFTPGGGYDTYARALSPYLAKYLPNNVNVVVKNIPGGGGLNGVAHLYRSRPDGYTIGYAPFPGMAVTALIEKNVGFDPYKLVPVAQIAITNQCLAVNAKSKIKTLKDMQNLPLVTFGSTSKGGSMYSFTSLAIAMLHLKAEIVTGYGGGAELIPSILRGDVQTMVMAIEGQSKYIESGDMRAILSFTAKRHPLLPNTPCVGEMGLEEATAIKDYKILFLPPGTPEDVQQTLQTAFKKAMADPSFVAWTKKSGKPISPIVGRAVQSQIAKIRNVYTKYKNVLK